MIDAQRDIEYLQSKHKELAEEIEVLEKRREFDRSVDGKVYLTSLKKQKLKLKEQIALLENA